MAASGGDVALAEAVVRIGDRQLRVDLAERPGALSAWDSRTAEGDPGLRPPSVELQKMVVADNAPNLAQVTPSLLLRRPRRPP